MNTPPSFSPLGAPPSPPAAPAPATLRGPRGFSCGVERGGVDRRVPLIAPDDAHVYDLARHAAARGCRLVHDGRRVYVTPCPLPEEFAVGRAA